MHPSSVIHWSLSNHLSYQIQYNGAYAQESFIINNNAPKY